MKNSNYCDNPIFIVGTGRCGTTLMRLLLNSTNEVLIGPENDFILSILNDIPELVWRFARHENLIKQRPAFYHRELIDYGFNYEFFLNLIKISKTRHDFINNFYAIYASRNGYSRWGENTPQNFQVADKLIKLFPNAKFLHLVRDCRDVALSYHNKDFGPDTYTAAAYLWTWRISLIRKLIRRFPDHFLTVRYEDFISNPIATADQITSFLDLSAGSIDLNNFFNNTEGVYDDRVVSTIEKSRIGRWKREMSESDSRGIVSISGKYLYHYGYIDTYSKKDHLRNFLTVLDTYYYWFFVRRRIRALAKLRIHLERRG